MNLIRKKHIFQYSDYDMKSPASDITAYLIAYEQLATMIRWMQASDCKRVVCVETGKINKTIISLGEC